MLQRLKKHWGVGTKELILILCTFAITGSLTAWLSKMLAVWLSLEVYGLGWWLSKILTLVFGYQVIILIVGFCFGMFPFFWKYEKKILSRFGLIKKSTPGKDGDGENYGYAIAVFASGTGSNAQKIIDHFKDHPNARVTLIVCNNTKAGVLSIATHEGIPVLILEKDHFMKTGYVTELQQQAIDVIVLAGFLWKVPDVLIKAFEERIINIHPALLPSYGGKGMYGAAVHKAVINAKEKQSGITIHYVDEHYDHGKIIFQANCSIEENETPESLAEKIHSLEHNFYAEKIEEVISQLDEDP